jgi:hypothetical protein
MADMADPGTETRRVIPARMRHNRAHRRLRQARKHRHLPQQRDDLSTTRDRTLWWNGWLSWGSTRNWRASGGLITLIGCVAFSISVRIARYTGVR